MANLRNPEIINFLGTSRLYRWRTNVIFGVMWYTDGHRWWSSVTSSEMVTLEIIWGENRLRNFDLRDFDNAIIAEGQYIAKCISVTCFSVIFPGHPVRGRGGGTRGRMEPPSPLRPTGQDPRPRSLDARRRVMHWDSDAAGRGRTSLRIPNDTIF
ncbi:hypothetical protein FBULB1_438 [Fusarium bulbicola]|nr:hypothetical protein FBULB1_438 [Fusarium bulbicola]